MAENDSKEQPVVEKSRKRLLGVLVTSVLIVGAGVAGTVLGPRLLGHHGDEADAEPSAEAQEETPEAESDKPPNPMAFQPIIVDVRDCQAQMHHMKIGVTVELKDGITKEEFERLMPRGRESAISYLRAKTFDELTDPAQFELITKELNERIVKAMGERHVQRIVITDFVAQ
ncbi:MAG: flagellar basal body-associated FliL family protein [Polyangiaceae bacterium]